MNIKIPTQNEGNYNWNSFNELYCSCYFWVCNFLQIELKPTILSKDPEPSIQRLDFDILFKFNRQF